MKLSKQLAILIGITVLGLVLLGFYALSTLQSSLVETKKDDLRTVLHLASNQAQIYIKMEQEGKLSRAEAEQKVVEVLSGLREGASYMWARDEKGLLRVHPNPDILGKPDLSKLPDGRMAYDSYLESLKTADIGYIANYIDKPGSKEKVLKINGFVNIPGWNWLLGLGVYMDDVDAAFWSFAIRFILVGVGVLVVVAAFAAWLARSIYRKLGGEPNYAVEVTSNIANGHLNQSIKGKFTAQSMLGSIVRMQESLQEMVKGINSGAQHLTKATKNLNDQMQTITKASQASSDATHSTAAAIQELSSCIDNISANTRKTATSSETSSKLALEGEGKVKTSAVSINDVSTQVLASTEQIAALQKRSAEIGSIVNVIQEIAEQTNLLALNAAIEAARAGEQGRGFAVVADEVRTLASRTATATSEITQTIDIIQNETQLVAKAMESVLPKVDHSVAISGEVSDMLTKIRSGTDETMEMIRDVAYAAEEQNQATETLAQHVEEISGMVANTANAVTESKNSVVELDQLALELHKSISFFKV